MTRALVPTVILLLSGCYPAHVPIAPPTYVVVGDSPIGQAELDAGLKACTDVANIARERAYKAHKSAFYSRRVASIATILGGTGATAASAAGSKDLATGLGLATVLSGVVTAALVDDVEVAAAEGAQERTLAQIAAVRTAYQRYSASAPADRPVALRALGVTLLECGYTPTPAFRF